MDNIWQVWNDLQRMESELEWGGHPPGLAAQYDSPGRLAQMGRVERVRRALDDSGPLAHSRMVHTLAGINLSPVRHLLLLACQDIALCYGGALVADGIVGGVGETFLGSFRAGAAARGQVPDGWVAALLGLKSLVDSQARTISCALQHYEMGFLEAWGPSGRDDPYSFGMTARGELSVAAFHLANGHAIMIPAILGALAGYLTKSKGCTSVLLEEIKLSPRLGPKVAAWVEENQAALCLHPALQSRGWGAAAEEAASVLGRQPIPADAFGNSLEGNGADKISGGNSANTLSLSSLKSDYTSIGSVVSSAPQMDSLGLLARLPDIQGQETFFASQAERDEWARAGEKASADNEKMFTSFKPGSAALDASVQKIWGGRPRLIPLLQSSVTGKYGGFMDLAREDSLVIAAQQ